MKSPELGGGHEAARIHHAWRRGGVAGGGATPLPQARRGASGPSGTLSPSAGNVKAGDAMSRFIMTILLGAAILQSPAMAQSENQRDDDYETYEKTRQLGFEMFEQYLDKNGA